MDVTRSAGYSGRPYTLNLRVYTLATSGNSSRYHHDAWGSSNSGYGSYTYADSTCNIWVANDYWGHFVGEMLFGPSDWAGKTIGYGSGDGNWKAHDGNGNLNFVIRAQHPAPGPFNTADTGDQWVSADRIGAVPGTPGTISFSSVTPTSAVVSWGASSRGNCDIDYYRLYWATNSGFSPTFGPNDGNNTSRTISSLNPGTQYWVRVYAHNCDGFSGHRDASFTTLPSSPPGMTIVASPAGSSATVTLSPPGGISGVDKYTVSWQYLSPAPIPNPATKTQDTTSNTVTIQNLVPGATYRWTATATIGGYVSPASANQDLAQPQPSTSPGDYFDGATAPRGDLTFSWTGTANNSTSTANGVIPSGWTHNARPGNTLRLQRITGGFAGAYAARMWVLTDAASAGDGAGMAISGGTSSAVIEAGATYYGSIYVRPSRSQRLVAELEWTNATGTVVGSSVVGASVLVTDTTNWTRLTVSGQAPAGAFRASVKAYDATGTGWSAWLSGQYLDVDAVMVSLGELFPYFDGSTPDTPEYNYSWLGTADASTSTRTPLSVTVDVLADPDCPPIPAPPRPPTVPSDCIADVGVWRRYWAYIPSSEVSDWLTTIPTLELETASTAERQVRVRVYPDPFGRENTQIEPGSYCSEQIISYIPPNTVMTLDGVTERAWAEVNGGSTISADHLLYGSDGTPAVWPQLSCGIGYWASFDVPNEAPAGNLTVRVFLTQRT